MRGGILASIIAIRAGVAGKMPKRAESAGCAKLLTCLNRNFPGYSEGEREAKSAGRVGRADPRSRPYSEVAAGRNCGHPAGDHRRTATIEFGDRRAARDRFGHLATLRTFVLKLRSFCCLQFHLIAQPFEASSRATRAA